MAEEEISNKEQVPVFKSWKSWYVLTILILVVQIVLYFGITKFFE